MASATDNIYRKHKTNFNKVMEFNRAFDMVEQEPSEYSCFVEDFNGNIKYNPFKNIRKNIFKDSPSIIKLRIDLIKEEIGELNDAINQYDLIEQRDACADILYVVYGMSDVLGISIDDLFTNKIDANIEYYINNNLTSDFVIKTLISANNSANNSAINNDSIYISNFSKIKLIKNEILGFDISSKSNEEIINFIKFSLKQTLLKLENNCCVNNIAIAIDYVNDETITNKFELVGDNLYNLLKWAYLMAFVIGTDADEDFAIVHDSNMSKLCDNEDDAKATVENYRNKYIAGVSPYDSPYYYYLSGLDKWIVKNLSTGKALKNIKYKKVCFGSNTNKRFVF